MLRSWLAMFSVCGLMLLSGCRGGSDTPAKVTLPDTPEGTVTEVNKALAEGKFEVIWSALPADYQHDIEHLLEDISGKMDAEVWNKGSSMLGKVAQLMNTKQDLIMDNAMVKGMLQDSKAEDVKAFLAGMGTLLSDIQGEAKTVDDLKKLNIPKLLSKIGANAKKMESTFVQIAEKSGQKMPGKMSDLSKVQVKVLENKGDTAKLEVTAPDGKKTETVMVKVKGKWLPKEFADGWAEKYKEIDDAAHDFKIDGPQKNMILGMLGGVEPMIDSLLKATTQAEFDQAVQGIAGMAGMFGGPPGSN